MTCAEEENAATVADAHASVSLEGPDKLPAEATGASPTSPSGKKWLTAADSPNQVSDPAEPFAFWVFESGLVCCPPP